MPDKKRVILESEYQQLKARADALNANTKPCRVFISANSGVIQDIITDNLVEVLVLDCDTEGFSEDKIKNYTDTYGNKFKARNAWDEVEVNANTVDHYFQQI